MKRSIIFKTVAASWLFSSLATPAFSQSPGEEYKNGGIVLAAKKALSDSDEAIEVKAAYPQYVDAKNGLTVDDLVKYGLEHNGELAAVRQMIAEARGRLHQAGLKPNPMVETSGSKAVTSPDRNAMISFELPLELGGRRQARVSVAEREIEMREAEVADYERKLAAEVRRKYVEALSAARNLLVTEELLQLTKDSHALIKARVEHGATAPLEQNLIFVEVNKIDVMRIGYQSKVEVALLELKRLVGMPAEEDLKIRGGFNFDQLPEPQDEALRLALTARPDLKAAAAAEQFTAAQAEQARTEGKVDASLFAGYQLMNFGFGERGFNSAGRLVPIADNFHYLTFGVKLTLPVRNKNQGNIEAALASVEAAHKRREFLEVVIRNEIVTAYVQFERAKSAFAVYRENVRNQSLKNLEVIKKTYTLGQKSILDYLAEQRKFIDVEVGYTDVMKEYLDALVEIGRARGSK